MASYRKNLFPVPNGFHDILRELSSNILKDQPEDILYYGMIYFESKLNGNQFKYEGPRRQQNRNKQQDLNMYTSLFETNQFKQDLNSQNLMLIKDTSAQSKPMSAHQKEEKYQLDVFSQSQFVNGLPENIPNIRLLEKLNSKQSQKSVSPQKEQFTPQYLQKSNLGQELKVQEIPVCSAQSISVNPDLIKSSIIFKDERNEEDTHNNLSQEFLNKVSKQYITYEENIIEQSQESPLKDSAIRVQASQKTQHMTNLTFNQDELTTNQRNHQKISDQLFELNHFSSQQQQTNIFEDKLLFQGLEDDFKQIDIAEADAKNENFYFDFQFLDGNQMDRSALTVIQSNYNIQSQLKGQILNYLAVSEQQPQLQPKKKIVQELAFSNQNQMKISMVESLNMGAYQKGFLYVNIMSARSLPLCMNATCELFLEGMPDQKIISQTVYNNNEPDWYYLKKKLILLVPKNTEKLLEEINQKPLFLNANIFETKYSKTHSERVILATFRIPLQSIFEKEGLWSINDYFDCQEEFQQAKLYVQTKFSLIKIQNSSLLQQQVADSIEDGNINPESDKKLTKSINRDIMASVDLNKENEKHARIIHQLILSLSNQSFRTQGTFKIVIIKARQLRHFDNPKLKIKSPLIEYTISADVGNKTVLYDPNPNIAEEPIWFHDSCHKIDIDLQHKPVISLKIYDVQNEDQSNKIYVGEINLDLSINVNQPGKWVINNYYDLHYKNSTDQVVGQIYLQSKFIPGGLEEFHQEQFGPLSFLD